MCHTTLVLNFHTVTSFDLTLTLTLYLALVSYLHVTFDIPSAHFAEFALAAVSGLVSAADKAKRFRFDL